MSTDATATSGATNSETANHDTVKASVANNKGKGKVVQDEVMDEEEDDDEEEEEEEEDDDDDMEEDNLEEIDPSAIITSSRRTRGVRVDYSSPEALQKAGLKPEHADEDEHEESFVANDDEMKDD